MNRDAWNRYSKRGNWYYEVVEGGFKYNLTDLQSALGIHQLRKLESFIAKRARYARIYNEAFAEWMRLRSAGFARLPARLALYVTRLNLDRLKINRQEFIDELRARESGPASISYRCPFILISAKWRCGPFLPRTMALFSRIVSLPMYPAMTEEQIHYVADSVKEIVHRNRNRRVARQGRKLSDFRPNHKPRQSNRQPTRK